MRASVHVSVRVCVYMYICMYECDVCIYSIHINMLVGECVILSYYYLCDFSPLGEDSSVVSDISSSSMCIGSAGCGNGSSSFDTETSENDSGPATKRRKICGRSSRKHATSQTTGGQESSPHGRNSSRGRGCKQGGSRGQGYGQNRGRGRGRGRGQGGRRGRGRGRGQDIGQGRGQGRGQGGGSRGRHASRTSRDHEEESSRYVVPHC